MLSGQLTPRWGLWEGQEKRPKSTSSPHASSSSDQGVRTLAKRKSSEVEEEAEPITSPKGAKTSGRKLIKTVAKKPSAKKVKVIEVIPDPPILDVEPLDEDLDDATTLSELTRKVDEQKQVLSGLIEA